LTIITSLLTFHPILTLKYLAPKLSKPDYKCHVLTADLYALELERWWSLLPQGQGGSLLNVEYDRYLRDAILTTEFVQKRAKFNGWKGIEDQRPTEQKDRIFELKSTKSIDFLLDRVYALIHDFPNSTIQTQLGITGLISALLAHPSPSLQKELLSRDLVDTDSRSLFTEIEYATGKLIATQRDNDLLKNSALPEAKTAENDEQDLMILRKRGEILGIASPLSTPKKEKRTLDVNHNQSPFSSSVVETPTKARQSSLAVLSSHQSPVRSPIDKGEASTQLSNFKVTSNSDLGAAVTDDDSDESEQQLSTVRSILILEEMVKETIALIQVQRSLGSGVRNVGAEE
jgi:hypothetical protein